MKNILKKIYLTALRAIPLVLPFVWAVWMLAEALAVGLGILIGRTT